MTIETATYLTELNASYPAYGDVISEGDDHVRLIKSCLQATFPGLSGALGRVVAKAAGYTVVANDNTVLFNCTAALTLSLTAAVTLGNKHHFFVYANGGDVVIDPNASETINGVATLTVKNGQFALVFCNASAFFSVGFVPPGATFTAEELGYLSGVTSAIQTQLDGKQAIDANTAKLNVAQSWTAQQTFKETKETVYTITDGAAFEIDPANGSVQKVVLGANRTPKGTNFESGQGILLKVDDGTARTLTWTDATWGGSGVVWVGGTAPTLATTGYTLIVLWRDADATYGKYVGTTA